MEKVLVKEIKCGCGNPINAVAEYAGELPTSGSVAVCMRCGELYVLGDDLNLQAPTRERRKAIENDPAYHAFEEARIRGLWRGRAS